MIERRFNHDLLISPEDQTWARDRWPAIAGLLIDAELLEQFKPHEEAARKYKKTVQWLGTTSVLLMLGALVGAASSLRNWNAPTAGPSSRVGAVLELLGAL